MPSPTPATKLSPDRRPRRRRQPAPEKRTGAETESNALFLTHFETIDEVIGALARRGRWHDEDAEDFRSWAYYRLLDDDCRALRSFRGSSSMRTYLFVVISNLSRDFRNARFGRWRPSAECVRLGRWAVGLDRLVNRDQLTRAEAVRVLASRADCPATEADLWRLVTHISARPRARPVGVDALLDLASVDRSDAEILASERSAACRSVVDRLDNAIRNLDLEDQAIVRLRFWAGLTVADVSRALALPQKPLYGRIERCLGRLRTELELQGVCAAEVRVMLEGGR